MNNTDLIQRITVNPDICRGRDAINRVSADMTQEEILADYPDLEKEDLQACLLFAAADKVI